MMHHSGKHTIRWSPPLYLSLILFSIHPIVNSPIWCWVTCNMYVQRKMERKMDCNTTSRQTLGYSKYEQDAEGIQNMFEVYLIVPVFIK